MRRYIIFSIGGLALLLSSISNSSSAVAFPNMVSELDAPLVIVGWVLTAYQLVSTIMMTVAGKLSDTLGTKSAFIIYAIFFCVGSILCAVAPNVYVLIGARVIQAVGGGSFLPCAAGIASDQFPEARQRYMGFSQPSSPLAPSLGPTSADCWYRPSAGGQSS